MIIVKAMICFPISNNFFSHRATNLISVNRDTNNRKYHIVSL